MGVGASYDRGAGLKFRTIKIIGVFKTHLARRKCYGHNKCIFEGEHPDASDEDRNGFINGVLEASEGFLLEAVVYSDLCSILPDNMFKLEQVGRTAGGEMDLFATDGKDAHLFEVKRSCEQVDAQVDKDVVMEKDGKC